MAVEVSNNKSAYDYVKTAIQNAQAASMTSIEAIALSVSEIRLLAEAAGTTNFVHRSIRQSLVYALQQKEKEASQEADRMEIETAIKKLTGLSAATAEIDPEGNIVVKTGK